MFSAGCVGIITSLFLFTGFFASLLFFSKHDDGVEKIPQNEIQSFSANLNEISIIYTP
jgi:hypothetical protein